MKTITFIATLVFFVVGCSDNSDAKKETIKTKDPNTSLIITYYDNSQPKSIIVTNADSSQRALIFFDSSGHIWGTRIDKNGKRVHAIEYYKNGRPKGLTNFDSTVTGDAVYYYENGQRRSEGRWENRTQVGIWKDYNDKGELTKIDTLE